MIDINTQLIAWSKEGYSPALLYNDGRWQVSFSSFGDSNGLEQCHWCEDDAWQITPQAAVEYALNDMGAFTHGG